MKKFIEIMNNGNDKEWCNLMIYIKLLSKIYIDTIN